MTEQEYLNSKALYHPTGGYKTGKIYDIRDTTLNVNIFPNSEDFSGGDWIKNSTLTVTSNQAVAPDGNTTADLIQTNGNLIDAYLRHNQSKETSTTYTTSFYFKYDTIAEVSVCILFNSGSDRFLTNFNIQTGAVVSTSSSGTGISGKSSEITNISDGWYRASMTYTTPSSISGESIQIGVGDDGTGGFTGGTGSWFLWGAQLEKGLKSTYDKTPHFDLTVTGGGGTRTLADGTVEDIGYYNLITYSEDLSNQKTNYGITIPSTTATGGIIQTDTTTGTHVVGVENIKDAGGGIVVAGYRSVIVKKVNWRYAAILNRTSGATGIVFDFDTAQTYVVEGTYAGSIQNVTVVDLGDGYYRVGFYTNAGSGSNDNLYVGFANGTTVNDVSFAGDGTQQMEVGALQTVDDVTTMQPYQRNAGVAAFVKVDYSNGTPEFLNEPERTNYVTNYNTFTDNGNYTKIQDSTVLDPEGNDSWKITRTGGSGNLYIEPVMNRVYGTGQKGVFSFYLRGSGSDVRVKFDGVVNTVSAVDIKADEWTRFSFVKDGLSDYVRAEIQIITQDIPIHMYGCQMEIDTETPTSLIRSLGANTTRTENYFSSKNTVDVYGGKWVYAEVEVIDPTISTYAVLTRATDDANGVPRANFQAKWNGSSWEFYCRPSNTGIETIQTGITATTVKLALIGKHNVPSDDRSHYLVINGSSFTNTDVSTAFRTDDNLDRMQIGSNYRVKNIQVFDFADYTVADMEAKTTL